MVDRYIDSFITCGYLDWAGLDWAGLGWVGLEGERERVDVFGSDTI